MMLNTSKEHFLSHLHDHYDWEVPSFELIARNPCFGDCTDSYPSITAVMKVSSKIFIFLIAANWSCFQYFFHLGRVSYCGEKSNNIILKQNFGRYIELYPHFQAMYFRNVYSFSGIFYVICTNFTCSFIFQIRRKGKVLSYIYLFPMVILSILSPFMFLFPYENSQRFTLGKNPIHDIQNIGLDVFYHLL